MFLRFSKGRLPANQYLKAVLLEDKVVMEFGNQIIGIAKLHNENEKYYDWDIVVATKCPLGGKKVERKMKDIIGRSYKYSINPSNKRRKYYVEYFEMAYLPIKVSLNFTSL